MTVKSEERLQIMLRWLCFMFVQVTLVGGKVASVEVMVVISMFPFGQVLHVFRLSRCISWLYPTTECFWYMKVNKYYS